MLLYGTICKAIGALFPQRPLLALRQELIFANPAPVDSLVKVRAWVIQEEGPESAAAIGAAIERPDGLAACQAHAVVQLADRRPGFGCCGDVDEKPFVSEAARYRHLAIGQKASIQKTFTTEDRCAYALLTGDKNPLCVDPQSAIEAGFRQCLVPGPLLSALFSQLLGTRLPGRGTNWLKQQLHFLAPAYWNDALTATVELVRLRPEKHLANLQGQCRDSQGIVVCRAQALVLVKDIEDQV
jgi:acyl dehydratase